MLNDQYGIEKRFWVVQDFGYRRQFQFRYGEKRDGQVAVAQPLIMKTVPTEDIVDPFMTVSLSAAQELMDSLWNCGLRPSELGSDNVGKEKALLNHLEDMRRLVPGLRGFVK